MCSHVPNKGEQMVRYYGYYSNVARGKRKKQDQDDLIPSILEYLRGGPPYLPQVPGPDANISVHRKPGNNQQNAQAPRFVGSKSKTPAQSQRATAKCPHRLLQILRFLPVRIIFTRIQIIPLRLTPHDFLKTGRGTSWNSVSASS